MAGRRLRSIAIGAGLSVAVLSISALAGSVLFYLQHHEARPASAANADDEFRQLRSRFAGQQALLDIAHDSSASPAAGGSSDGERPRSFHAVVFDTRNGGRIVHVEMPYWLVRLSAPRDGRFTWLGQLTFLDDTEFDRDPIDLSLDRIERRGRGLLVDVRHAGGGRFVAWVE